MTHSRPSHLATHTNSGPKPSYIRPKVGVPTLAAHYTTCEYTAPSTHQPTTPGQQPTTAPGLRCANQAIIMPGYHRACALHVTHMLRASLATYMQRPTAAQLPTSHQEALMHLLALLATPVGRRR